MDGNYYAGKLNADRLRRVYDTAIPRAAQYLNAEINFVAGTLTGRERLLELGCGYGRVLRELSPRAGQLAGIDIAAESIALGRDYLAGRPNVVLKVMDAHRLEFGEDGDMERSRLNQGGPYTAEPYGAKPPGFEVVVCLQNGLSALKGDPSA